jgi:membrane-bound serine protease (ClpP class)
MDAYLAWASLLLLLGLGLVMLEVFVPSGGILGCLAGISLLVAVILAFVSSPYSGLGFVAICIVALPICLAVALHYWPSTPMGRRILLPTTDGDEMLPDDEFRRELKDLVGKLGVAKSLMLPSGAVQVGDRLIDAVSEGPAIEPGQKVRVIEVRSNRVVVSPAEDSAPVLSGSDELSRPIDTIGLDPFEDPLA